VLRTHHLGGGVDRPGGLVGIQITNVNMLVAVKEMFSSINKFPLAAIPFFILAGNLMETGGISRRLVEFAKSLVGGVQGGLPMTCVLTCMIFAAVSGSSVATTFAIGAILIPALIKHGYPRPTRPRCRPPAPSWAWSSRRRSR
jgi:C4-dicarboxylate transporter, DctM subunit